MKEEIIGGLRNALERSETIEKAMQTFINAGYSAAEVREAAGMINPSATGLLYGTPREAATLNANASAQSSKSASSVRPQNAPEQQPVQKAEAVNLPTTIADTQQSQMKGRKTAIILAIVLILLVIVLGVTLFFSGNLLDLFSS